MIYSWITVLSLGLATNLDNVCVGIAYGLSGKRISFGQNVLLSLISGAFALGACEVARWVNRAYARFAMTMGALMLVALGIYTVAGARKTSEPCDGRMAVATGAKEMLLLGVTLALNCLAASFGVGLNGVPATWAGTSVAIFSVLSIGLGNQIGLKARRALSGQKLTVASGALLIAMGVWELFV